MLHIGDLSIDKRLKKLARNCLIFSLLMHLLCAWFVNWIYHPDQLFQILEFGGYKLGVIHAGDLAWEYGAQLRSAAQPAMVFFSIKNIRIHIQSGTHRIAAEAFFSAFGLGMP